MKALARSYLWWPVMDTDIEQSIKSCKSCQLHETIAHLPFIDFPILLQWITEAPLKVMSSKYFAQ